MKFGYLIPCGVYWQQVLMVVPCSNGAYHFTTRAVSGLEGGALKQKTIQV